MSIFVFAKRADSKRHSNKLIRITPVSSETEDALSRLDVAAGNLRVRIERRRKGPYKAKEKNRLVYLILVIFLLLWTFSGNPSMTFDDLTATIFQLIFK
jgi:hypothetical protein